MVYVHDQVNLRMQFLSNTSSSSSLSSMINVNLLFKVSTFSRETTMNIIIAITLLSTSINAFGIQFPIKLPFNTPTTKALQPGDNIAVIGASGNVGKLVTLRLSDTYNVKGIVRDASLDFFKGREDRITLYEVDLLDELRGDGMTSDLQEALRDTHAIVICTGTTAFPTKAWSRQDTEITPKVLSSLFDSKFNIQEAIRKLDQEGLNTPHNIDNLCNQFILKAWNQASKVKKRAILLSSIGVQRRNSMPFSILNTCGVLSAKAIAEETLINESQQNDYNYSIIRPGQLFGGPYDNNYYLGTLFQLDKDADTQGVEVGRGDELLGDTLRSTLAEITAQVCELDRGVNMDFAVVNVKGDAPGDGEVESLLQSLDE